VATLVLTDLGKDSAAEQQMVRHLMRVAVLIERLYARQTGVLDFEAQIPRDDVASRAMFHRNQSPFCEAPRTEKDPACSALAQAPKRISGLYPPAIQQEPGFCHACVSPNAAALMDHFSIVTGDAAPASWKAVLTSLGRGHVCSGAGAACRGRCSWRRGTSASAYLRAAADSFASNDWEPANRAWVAMNAHNSRWYTRIGPDEVYFDPCAWKGGFALQLARINPDSIAWQERLEPHKAAMEQQIAKLAGPPYRARNVQFKLPDFIDVVLNAGDQRSPHGATIGQSLPNWGPVAAAGGRTVAMTNLYTDPDSRARSAALQSAVPCKASDARLSTGKREVLDSLHEAAHNLGPSHDYRVAGRTAPQAFGGPLASTLEELKAQNSALYLLSLLEARGVLQPDEVLRTLRGSLGWAFGHISRGMYAVDGTPRNYSQLAAIQIGSFLDAGRSSGCRKRKPRTDRRPAAWRWTMRSCPPPSSSSRPRCCASSPAPIAREPKHCRRSMSMARTGTPHQGRDYRALSADTESQLRVQRQRAAAALKDQALRPARHNSTANASHAPISSTPPSGVTYPSNRGAPASIT
jgi:hypothetical protein